MTPFCISKANGTLLFLFTMIVHTSQAYCEEGTPAGVTLATLIIRTSVDVTLCY